MGCDIHATLEYNWHALRPYKEGEPAQKWWRSFAHDIEIDRNYSLFSILADVRNSLDLHPIASPRGMPKDASYEFKDELADWESDAHSTSWATFGEISGWKPNEDETAEWDLEDYKQDDWYKTMELLAEKYGDEEVRLCFFFDN